MSKIGLVTCFAYNIYIYICLLLVGSDVFEYHGKEIMAEWRDVLGRFCDVCTVGVWRGRCIWVLTMVFRCSPMMDLFTIGVHNWHGVLVSVGPPLGPINTTNTYQRPRTCGGLGGREVAHSTDWTQTHGGQVDRIVALSTDRLWRHAWDALSTDRLWRHAWDAAHMRSSLASAMVKRLRVEFLDLKVILEVFKHRQAAANILKRRCPGT